MKISYKTIIIWLYSVGMLSVLIRGYLVYELGMEYYIKVTGQVISLIEIGISFILILSLKNIKNTKSPKDITLLKYALIFFVVIQAILGMINSQPISLSIVYFIVMILMLTVIDYDYRFFNKLTSITYNTFFLICFFSLIFMCFGYGMQVNGEYQIVSKIGVRLYGFTQHANSLGPIAALVCIYSYYKNKKVHFFIGLITLWYSQSKTNLIILLICIIIDLLRRVLKYINRDRVIYLYMLLITNVSVLIFSMIYYLIVIEFSFTGRTGTWKYYLDSWMSNLKTIIIGCNSSILYLHKYAENMFIDMITRFGVIGFLIFIYLLIVILKITWKNMKSGYDLSFALFIFLFFRSITESIFINTNMGFGDFFNLVFLIIIEETYLRNYATNENKLGGN